MDSALREMFASAQTEEDLDAALALVLERTADPLVDDSSRWVVKTHKDVAAFFGCHYKTVAGWRKEADPMPGSPGAWDLREIVQWRFKRVFKGEEVVTETARLNDESKKLAVEMQRVKLARESGDVVLRSVVQSEARAAYTRLKGRLEALPDELAPVLPAAQRDDMLIDLRDKMVNFLQELANYAENPTGE